MGTIVIMTFCTVQRVTYLSFNRESLIQSQVPLLLCPKWMLQGLSLWVKKKKKTTKRSPKQNAVIATPSSLLRKSFQRNLTLRRRKTWPLPLQFTYPRLFQKNMLKQKHQGSTRAFQTRHQKNNSLSSKDYITLTLDIFQILTDQVSTAVYPVVQITW